MEFLGFSNEDFDFFRKKDKMLKQEYEKRRNDIKHHFRSFCYELQKLYHKKTGGVLEIDKEFSSFNKKSVKISAEYGEKSPELKKIVELNAENLSIKLCLKGDSEETGRKALEYLKLKKTELWNYIFSDKHNQINYVSSGRGNKINSIKYNSFELNDKNYDNFIELVEKNINNKNFNFEINIIHNYPKGEAVKQGKNLTNIIYDRMSEVRDLAESLAK